MRQLSLNLARLPHKQRVTDFPDAIYVLGAILIELLSFSGPLCEEPTSTGSRVKIPPPFPNPHLHAKPPPLSFYGGRGELRSEIPSALYSFSRLGAPSPQVGGRRGGSA